MKEEICGTCKFRSGDEDVIECHRYAPRPKMENEVDQGFTDVAWPTLAASDWCGEWEAEK